LKSEEDLKGWGERRKSIWDQKRQLERVKKSEGVAFLFWRTNSLSKKLSQM